MKVTLTVCDVCNEKDAPTKPYEIKQGDRKAKVDLCEAHGQPFEAYLHSVPAKRSGRPATAPARRTARKTTMEDIEKLKR